MLFDVFDFFTSQFSKELLAYAKRAGGLLENSHSSFSAADASSRVFLSGVHAHRYLQARVRVPGGVRRSESEFQTGER